MINMIYNDAFHLDENEDINFLNLSNIHEYCKKYNENIIYQISLMDQKFNGNESLYDWLYTGEYDDEHALLIQLFQEWENVDCLPDSEYQMNIGIKAGNDVVTTVKEYISKRRLLLSCAKNWQEFLDILFPCYDRICFSENVKHSIKKIKDLNIYAKDIENDLNVLNDEGKDIFERNKKEPDKAIKELSSKVTECTNDPKHKNDLFFEFRDDNGNDVEICCQIHTKVHRRNSNIRIYFNWGQPDILHGKKLLIGHIGKHPY